MQAIKHRALIVEDEEAVQKLTILALGTYGYDCDVATDGDQAARMAAQSQYDVVITDLRMPKRNGHSLALELLQQKNRPAIVVHTGIVEPRLTKDLLSRGVDDILFKPIDYSILAAKVEAILQRRSQPNNAGSSAIRQAQ